MQLSRLAQLNLTDCRALAALPDGLTALTTLRVVSLDGCAALARPPELAAWTAAMFCRQLDARFAAPAERGEGGGDGRKPEGGGGAAAVALPQASELTLQCLRILR